MIFDFDIGLPARFGLRCDACGAMDPRVEIDRHGEITHFACGQCEAVLTLRAIPTQLELDL